MKTSPSPAARISAFIAYLLPVLGWIYLGLFQRQNRLAIFHLKQAISLVLFLLAAFFGWAIIGYLLAFIPYGAVFSVAFFSLVLFAFIVGAVIWIIGMVNALRGRMEDLPFVGGWAKRFTF
jgi:uncharacterized membrane protein